MTEHDDGACDGCMKEKDYLIFLPHSVGEAVIRTGQALLNWIDTPPTEIPHDIDPVTHSMALEEDFRVALTSLKEAAKETEK